jgi:methionyl-tRNA formyltransferase
MRLLFAGSPEIAVPSLEAAAAFGDVVGVLTNPDSVQGRGKKVKPTPVKQRALELGIPVLEFSHLYAGARKAVRELQPDLLVTFAYGRIFGPKFLSLFSLGGINVHPSLLPEFRGSSPIQAAIMQGKGRTGITIQRIALEMDSGDILSQQELALSGTETTKSLSEIVAGKAPTQLKEVLSDIDKGTEKPVKQDDALATYCSQIEKKDALIDWNQSASRISCQIRAYYPWPKAETTFDGQKLMITYALPSEGEQEISARPGTVVSVVKKRGILIATGEGMLCVTQLQLQSKKEMDFSSFLNGNSGFIGSLLGR